MNKERREQVSTILAQLTDIQSQLLAIRDEEQEYYENSPASLFELEGRVEMVVDALCQATYGLSDVMAGLRVVINRGRI